MEMILQGTSSGASIVQPGAWNGRKRSEGQRTVFKGYQRAKDTADKSCMSYGRQVRNIALPLTNTDEY